MIRSDLTAGLVSALLLALIWTVPFQPDHSWGWDESMHAALPAARMLTEFQAGELQGAARVAVEDCQLYPFGYPVFLAAVQSVFGFSEHTTRVAGRFLFCFGLFGVFLLAGEIARSLRRRTESAKASLSPGALALAALAFGALSPLAFAFSGTLFLEVPFLVAEVFCLWAWFRRTQELKRPAQQLRADLLAGVLLAVCFFTKFNYACLLFAGLGLDLVFQAWQAKSRGEFRPFALRAARLAAPLALALLWWFAWPWPGEAGLAAQHRENFLSFLGGNRAGAATPWSRRILDWSAAFVPTARFGLLVLLGVLLSLRQIKNSGVRLLWLVLLALGVPIALHPFHLERFLIPLGPAIWILAALGLGGLAQTVAARISPRPARWALGLLVLASCLVFPERDARFVAKRVGIWNEEQADYLTGLFATWRDLSPTRKLPSAGLRTDAADRMLGLIADEQRAGERLGWIGISTEMAPAAIQLGVLERGGSLESFRRDAGRQLWLDFRGADPDWNVERFGKWAGQFEVIFCTDPPDLKQRASRVWTRSYVDRLMTELGWNRKELGTVSIERPNSEPLIVTLFACRPPQ